MRLLGIDLGSKTMGISVTDSLQMVVNGIENFTYSNNNLDVCLLEVKRLIDYYHNDVEKIILGYPLNVNGSKSKQTIFVESFYQILTKNITIPIVLQDERYSTLQATNMMKFDVGLKSSQIKKIKDKMSAVVILQEYMESHRDQ